MSTTPVTPKIGKRGAEAHIPSGGGFNRTEFFSLENGGTTVVRFLTDFEAVRGPDGELVGGWPAFLQHQNIPTKPAPADYKGKWPATMPANCRRDPQFGDAYDDCYICDVIGPTLQFYKKPGQRYFALGVLREAVKEDGKILGYRDKTVEVTIKAKEGSGEEDKVVKQKAVVVLNMAWKNFFSILNGYASAYGTVLDRDYQITRQGEKLDTTYTIIPLNPISTDIKDADGTVIEAGVDFDLRNDKIMARYLPNAATLGYAAASDERLIEIIAERASDDFYGRFFDATYVAPASAGGGGGGNTEAQSTNGTVPAAAPAPDQATASESVNRLVDRIQGAGAQAYTPPAEESAPAEQVPVAAGAQRDFS